MQTNIQINVANSLKWKQRLKLIYKFYKFIKPQGGSLGKLMLSPVLEQKDICLPASPS